MNIFSLWLLPQARLPSLFSVGAAPVTQGGGRVWPGATASLSWGSQPCPEQTPPRGRGDVLGAFSWGGALRRAPKLPGQEGLPRDGVLARSPHTPRRDPRQCAEASSSSQPKELGIPLNVLKCPLGLLESGCFKEV